MKTYCRSFIIRGSVLIEEYHFSSLSMSATPMNRYRRLGLSPARVVGCLTYSLLSCENVNLQTLSGLLQAPSPSPYSLSLSHFPRSSCLASMLRFCSSERYVINGQNTGPLRGCAPVHNRRLALVPIFDNRYNPIEHIFELFFMSIQQTSGYLKL